MSTSNGAPATHTGRPAQHSGPIEPTLTEELPESVECEFCDNAVLRTRMADHILAQHRDELPPEIMEVGTFDKPGEFITTGEPGFHLWWRGLVDEAAPTIQRKAGEYGSNSLAEMGRMFARAQGRDRIEDHEALEIGCMIYAKGKLERVLDAMLKGRLPSTDTWHDLGVYASMAQYIRENKRWP